MVHPCDKPCGNKAASGYCATTACINPQFSNIGIAQYGQGVQKCMTWGDKIRAMTDEELAEFIGDDPMYDICPNNCHEDLDRPCKVCVLDWLKREVTDG